ncbi:MULTISPECIES: sodium/proline symporter PutP [Pseudoalteromonas]|jgi:SSS family solute:Na+ symporter/sodium/proline symporter|uniref:Sodium/proline symporter n=1 Tax=Pseudoalteromonas lipolytica TaxID=570156 RepID=A0AAD0S1Y9_9GAMM|nr:MULTISPECIES: sodium/proline symporter PutP [Pseudoalteromonas]AXV64676.1 sodium/proline symporter PutP [Pseudoalteromonas donghaensis]MBE0351550.1 solute:Na+ symporter, SSS family [Pseudoalteromonas lipolytica LMEB 39]MCC9661837.1 sodium/proline symporter PutP [Pseudoalteromonas sp. MB41]QLJ09163.1 sodium/proline symporter PutP [Pseudoalteromonas sp. JSTW]QMW15391.1 sodium/proline symporter PutP [Pseudoalteromonas sp. MT33b]
MIISLALYFIVMLGIGLYAYKQSTDDVSGYMLGGRNLSPSVAALSAGASDMSGWLLMGLPGAMYLFGLSKVWIAIGLVLGAWANYFLVAPRLRVYTEKANDSITIPDYFANRFDDNKNILRVISAIVIIVFFTLYTSSGVVAGGKLFENSFNMSYEMGLYITTGVVVVYTLFGGFLAVSLTDFVQGCIMFISLLAVPIATFTMLDQPFMDTLANARYDLLLSSPKETEIHALNMMDWFAGGSTIAIISAMAWGLGYFGQPHIIVRFMSVRSVKDMPTMRRIGMSWMTLSAIGAVFTGLFGAAYMLENQMPIDDKETIFLVLSELIFHPLIAGFLLAAILAAIMSTISSQLLVCSSSLTEDFYKIYLNRDASQKELVLIGRVSVMLVAVFAIYLAYDRDNSILDLVSNAWAGFGAAFGPLVLLSLYWRRMNLQGAIAGMVVGAATVLFWIYAPITIDGEKLSAIIYEIVPGFILSSIAIVVVSLNTSEPKQEITQLFDEVESSL